jgi:integrase/recombinase XerD
MQGLQPPRVTAKLVPVFTSEELSRLERACAGRTFAQRRDTAIIAVFTATGIRLSELAGLRCSDVDLSQREITVRGNRSSHESRAESATVEGPADKILKREIARRDGPDLR